MSMQQIKVSVLALLCSLVQPQHSHPDHNRLRTRDASRTVPRVGTVSTSGLEVIHGNGTEPCRLSFSKDRTGQMTFEIVPVWRCGNETFEASPINASGSEVGPTLPPGTEVPAVTHAPVTPTAAPVLPTHAPVTPTAAPVLPTHAPVTPTAAPTSAPVTSAPVTLSPTTSAPVIFFPTTAAPWTLYPVTSAPVTSAPFTSSESSIPPTTGVPVTSVPDTSPPSPSSAPSSTPTSSSPPTSTVCPGYSYMERSAVFLSQALVLSGAAISDPSSPQFRAMEWILSKDGRFLCPSDDNFVQRYVLATLFYSTNGEAWTSGDHGFLSGVSECSWKGIKCDNTGSVSKMSLDKSNLHGILPKELGHLSNLIDLNMDKNALTGTIPSSLGQLSGLVFLDLDENQFVGTIPEEIYDLTLLRALDLDRNKLIGTISTRIGQLTNLFIVQYDGNPITGTLPTETGLLTSLGYFTVQVTNLTGTIPQELCALSKKVQIAADCDRCTAVDCCDFCVPSNNA